MHKGKRKWLCLDCGQNTSQMREHYFVKSEVWFTACDTEAGMLCVGCLELRLERRLVPADFTAAHINDYRHNDMSTRLLERIRG